MSGRVLIATDLDRTLIPNGAEPESPGARALFARVAARPDVVLAYVTGRHRALVEAAIAEYGLPVPDYLIGDVGSTVYRVEGGDWRPIADWEMFIAGDWQGREAGDLAPALAGLAGLRLQEAAKQNRHKLSYYTPLLADPAGLLAEARARLAGLGAAVNLVWSVDEAAAVGLLDVLPASAGKLHALAFLAERLELGPARTLFAGDSGNDLEVLAGPFPAVLVANATASVRHQARALAAANGTGGRLYLAEGGWRGLNGNYSAGILEGLAHFLPEYLP